jgi:hypothetical protein
MALTRHSTLPWEEAWPGNCCGVASALTEIGPLRMGSLEYKVLRGGFWLRWWWTWFRNKKRRPLRELGFIHFARWVLIDQLPTGDGGMKRLRPMYLFFESNFNGGFDEYIDAFAYVITNSIQDIFGATVGFPGAEPAEPFKAFIKLRGYEAEHFYSAYPHATAGEIAVALRTRALLSSEFASAPEDDEAFARAWRAFVTKAKL